MKKEPLVSVILPVKNNEKTIKNSAKSVLDQSYSNLELIVVMNGCTDNTESELLSLRDDRIKLTESNPGVVPAMNMGLKLSRGSYIARQDGDDLWMQDKLKQQLEKLESDSSIDILGTQMLIQHCDGMQEITNYPTRPEECNDWLRSSMNPIGNPSVVYRSKVLEKVGGYWEVYPLAEDMDFFFRCLPHYAMTNLESVQVVYNYVPKKNYDSRIPRLMTSAYNYVYENIDKFKLTK